MTWPSTASKTNTDQGTDDPKQALLTDLVGVIDKFNQIQAHVTSFMQTLLDDTDAATARATLGVGKVSHPRKTADQTVNNSIIVVNDTHLKYALAANESAKFSVLIEVIGTTTADFKCTFSVPTGATMRWAVTQPDLGDGTARNALEAAQQIALDLNVNNEGFIVIDGWVDNGSNAGDLQFQWAQATADASNTTVKTGSTLTVWTM